MKKRYIWLIEIIAWLIIISAGICLFVYNTAVKSGSKNTYYMFLDDAGGLVKGSPVRLMGINIGSVKDIKIFENKVFISMLVSKKGIKIPNSAEASVQFYGLGGSASLELAPNALKKIEHRGEIKPSKSYRVQDYWNGVKLTADTMINIYGSMGRNIDKSGILNNKHILFKSAAVDEIIKETEKINCSQNVIINKLEENNPLKSGGDKNKG